MKVVHTPAATCANAQTLTRDSRGHRIAALAGLVALVCSGTTSCTRTQVALSATAIGVIVAGTAVGVTYAVKHHTHTLEGCVFSEAGGLKLRTGGAKVYALKGDAAAIKTGFRVSLHGSKIKKSKGDSGDQVFEVQRLNKEYGTCSAGVGKSPSQTP